MSDWKLTRKGDACTRCERAYEDEEPYYSVLFVRGDELVRQDVCTGCFGPPDAEGAPANPGTPDGEDPPENLIFWRGRHRIGKKAVAVDFEVVEGLFLALEGREETRLRELRYLLALLLMRKKRLKLVRTAKKKDGEAMLMRRPRRKEELLVYVFDLQGERAETLRAELRRIFEGADLEAVLASAPEEPTSDPAEDSQEDDAVEGSEGAQGAAEGQDPGAVAPDPDDPEAEADPVAPGDGQAAAGTTPQGSAASSPAT